MKNVVFLLVDAVYFESLGFRRAGHSPTPYLDALFAENTYFSNFFSQAPFTEAATHSIFSGENTLDGLGNIFGIEAARKTMGELFRDNGYETHSNLTTYPYLTPYARGFDQIYYGTSADAEAVWEYRLKHYAQQRAHGARLDPLDDRVMRKLLDDTFCNSDAYLEAVKNDDKSAVFDRHRITDIETVLRSQEHLRAEVEAFRLDRKGYVDRFLHEGRDHALLRDYHVEYAEMSPSFARHCKTRTRSLFRRAFLKSLDRTLRNKRLPANAVVEALKYGLGLVGGRHFGRLKNELGKYLLVWPRTLVDLDLQVKTDTWTSMWLAVEHTLDLLEHHRGARPLFVMNHIFGLHNPFRFLSNDIEDEDHLAQELSAAGDYLDNADTDSKYLLSYDFTLCYLDRCVGHFVESLKQKNLWKDTLLILTSDHGNSFTGATLRKNTVNNFYDENYHIPLLIAGADVPARHIDSLGSTVDLLPTLIDWLGLAEDRYPGVSLLRDKRDIVTFEYLGSGCPDWRRRGINLSVRSDLFKLIYIGAGAGEFEPDQIKEAYDLEADPGETVNLAASLGRQAAAGPLLEALAERFREIRRGQRLAQERFESAPA